MIPCDCTETHVPRRLVLTGGPGAGWDTHPRRFVIEATRRRGDRSILTHGRSGGMTTLLSVLSEIPRRPLEIPRTHARRELNLRVWSYGDWYPCCRTTMRGPSSSLLLSSSFGSNRLGCQQDRNS